MKGRKLKWDEISLEQGMRLFTIETTSATTEDSYFKDACTALDIDYSDIKLSEIVEAKKGVWDLLSTKPPTEFNDEFIIGGKRYLLIKLNDRLWSEFIDAEGNIDEDESGFWKSADKVLAMLIRPVEKVKTKNPFSKPQFKPEKYNPKSIHERAELFKKAFTMRDIYGIALFFYLNVVSYTKLITTTFLKKAQDIRTSELKNLEKYGDGFTEQLNSQGN